MKLVYVCSPYRGDIAANLSLARSYCRQVVAEGDAPLAPHLSNSQFMDDTGPWRACDLAWLAVCDEVQVWGETISEGMREEIAEAERLCLPVRRRDDSVIFYFGAAPILRSETILEEARRVTTTDRPARYAPPGPNMAVTSKLVSAFLGIDVGPRKTALLMVLFKMGREGFRPTRDNLVDIAGWAQVADLAEEVKP